MATRSHRILIAPVLYGAQSDVNPFEHEDGIDVMNKRMIMLLVLRDDTAATP